MEKIKYLSPILLLSDDGDEEIVLGPSQGHGGDPHGGTTPSSKSVNFDSFD